MTSTSGFAWRIVFSTDAALRLNRWTLMLISRIVAPDQGELLTQIELLINAEIPKLHYPDFKPGPVPRDVLESQALDAKRAEVAQNFNRFAQTTPKPVTAAVAADPTKFPGGIVPTKLPPKRMQGKVKTTRSMKAAIAETMQSEKPPPKP